MVQDVLRIPNAALRFKPDTAVPAAAPAATSAGSAAKPTETTQTTQTAQTVQTQTATTSGGQTSEDRSARWHNRHQAGQTSTSPGGLSPEERTARMGNRSRGIGGAAGALGAGAPPTRRRPQTVYILGADNTLKALEIRTGITDGHYTQVVSGDLKVGDLIVAGLATSKVDSNPPPGSSNPMGGARPGGAGGRGGR
jgi:HlyD family secretion protein